MNVFGRSFDAFKDIFKRFYLLFVLAIVIIFFGIASPNFFTVTNITNVFVQNVYTIIATIGISLIMISGGADMSVSYLMSLSAIITSICLLDFKVPVGIAFIIGFLSGASLGLINGLLSITLKVHTMIVTLATMTIFEGMAYLISNSNSYFNFPDAFKAIGQQYIFGVIPICVVVMVVMVGLASFILNKTYFGRYIYAIGGNRDAARLAGINVSLVTVISFVIAGAYIGCASMILTARSGSANAGMAKDAVFDCITACVLGGISFFGGEGKVWGVVTGCLIIGFLANGMQLVGMGIYPQYIAKGIILVVAIGYDTHQQNRKVKMALGSADTKRDTKEEQVA